MSIKKLLVVLFISLLVWPVSAAAAPNKELKAELQGYVDSIREDENARATFYALMSQAVIDKKSAKKDLVALAKDADATVRMGAGMGLVLAGGRNAEATLVAELAASPQLYEALVSSANLLPEKEEVQVLKALLKAAKPEQVRDIFRYLAGQYGDVYDVLGEYLLQKDPALRAPALEAALYTAHEDAGDYAEKMLKSKDEAIRADGLKLAIGLAQSPGGSAKAVAVLKSALKNKTAAIADQSARYLVEQGHKEGVDFLAAALTKEEDEAKKLGLATFLLAHQARVDKKISAPLMESENKELQSVGWQLAAVTGDAEVLAKINEMFGSTNFDERIIAVKSLGLTGSTTAVGLLSRALFEGERTIRLDAARGLGQLGKPGALDALQRAMSAERDREVKLAVIEAVASIKNPKSLQILRFQTTDRDPQVKLAVVQGMRKLGDKDVLSAMKVLKNDRDLAIQWQVFLSTLEISPKQGLADMPRALRNPPADFMDDIVKLKASTRIQVLEYLLRNGGNSARAKTLVAVERLGDEALDLARKVLLDGKVEESTRLSLLKLVAAKNSPKDQVLLEKLVRGTDGMPALQQAAVAALLQYTSSDLGATYRGLLGSKDPVIRAQAAYGLAVID